MYKYFKNTRKWWSESQDNGYYGGERDGCYWRRAQREAVGHEQRSIS